MYDILFIDDKFEEIKKSFSYFQKEHIRCFYSDGEYDLPNSNKERLPFQNLKYISLDLHLKNRGITAIKNNKNALSTLSSVIKSFVNDGKNITIIVNTSFPNDFDEDDFFKYLDFNTNPTIEKKVKKNQTSSLHDNPDNIIQQAHQEILRNVVIREAIEIENLILKKIRERFGLITTIEKFQFGAKINQFSAKINLLNLVIDNQSLIGNLNELRTKRNQFAHGSNLPEQDLLEFLESVENLKQEIKSLN